MSTIELKKLVVLIVASFWGISQIFSQSDSLLVNKLFRPITNCEIVSYNCQEDLVKRTIDQDDSIKNILSIWKKYCGEAEPILRIEVLMSIHQSNSFDSSHINYIDQYLSKYQQRVKWSCADQYSQYYETWKGYLDYIPLRGMFDQWTKEIALELISNQKLNSSEYLLCLLFSDSIDRFNNERNRKEHKDCYLSSRMSENQYSFWNDGLTMNVLSGVWIPLGKLSTTFSPSPHFGFSFGAPVTKSLRIDLGVSLNILINDKKFDLYIEDSIQSVNGTMCVTLGVWITKEFVLNKSLFLDISGGVGLGAIDTNRKKSQSNNTDSNDNYYGMNTIDVSMGIGIRKKVFDRNSIGIQITYHFAPYELDDILVKRLGNQFSSLALSYRF
ncbi:MAG: hypothetical protein Q7J34_05225 [Bacteroidales bacterium]|nr:hypothetical protein [Bacteroidales bacterium]